MAESIFLACHLMSWLEKEITLNIILLFANYMEQIFYSTIFKLH